jgi:hypothetical protein
MGDAWAEAETGTYQEHVIAHVIGAAVLGHFEAEDAVHLLLDIDFVWTIYVDGQMLLRHERLALSELDTDDATRAQLATDFDLLHARDAEPRLARRAPQGCVIREVGCYASGARLLFLLRGDADGPGLAVEADAARGSLTVRESARGSGLRVEDLEGVSR